MVLKYKLYFTVLLLRVFLRVSKTLVFSVYIFHIFFQVFDVFMRMNSFIFHKKNRTNAKIFQETARKIEGLYVGHFYEKKVRPKKKRQ